MVAIEQLASAHESLVELLRRLPPRVLIHAACRTAGIEPCEIIEVRERTPSIEISGLSKRARRLIPDLVYTVHTVSGDVLEIWIFEAQLSKDWSRRWRWGLYPVAYSAELERPARLAVIALDPDLREWLATRLIPQIEPRPILISPDQFELITDHYQARQRPRETVLGAVYHANGPRPAPQRVAGIRAAFAALQMLDPLEDWRYTVLMLSTAPEFVIKQAIEEARDAGEIDESRYETFTEFERKGYSFNHGLAEGLARGLRMSIVDVLELRGFTIPLAVRARVRGCEDAATLERWYALAKSLPAGSRLDEHLR